MVPLLGMSGMRNGFAEIDPNRWGSASLRSPFFFPPLVFAEPCQAREGGLSMLQHGSRCQTFRYPQC
jgi:hypothetical protein